MNKGIFSVEQKNEFSQTKRVIQLNETNNKDEQGNIFN